MNKINMIKRSGVLMSLCCLYASLHAGEGQKALSKVHVIYSHPYLEQSQILINKSNERLPGKDKVVTFSQNKTLDRNKKAIRLGDGDETFINSSAQKFAWLGDSLSVPAYPDAPGNWSQAVLFTKPAVHVLANELYNRVIEEKKERIVLVGRCVGAGIALNCLKSLVDFENNEDYFVGSFVKFSEDAQKIIKAINNGAFIVSVPLLSLEKYNAIAMPSALATALTYAAGMSLLMNSGDEGMFSDRLQTIFAGIILAEWSAAGCVKKFYTKIITTLIVPLISRLYYDPRHEQPIDRIEILKGKITSPVLLHFLEQDGRIQWLDDDLKRLLDAFKGENARLLITDDVGHMQMSPKFLSVVNGDFLNSIAQAESGLPERCEWVSEGEPKAQQYTVENLDKKIHPYGILSRMWEHHKYALSGIILFYLISLIPELYKQVMPA